MATDIISTEKKQKIKKVIEKRREKRIKAINEEIKSLTKAKKNIFSQSASRGESQMEAAPIKDSIRRLEEEKTSLLEKQRFDRIYGEAELFKVNDDGEGFIKVLIMGYSEDCPYKGIIIVSRETKIAETIFRTSVGEVGECYNGRKSSPTKTMLRVVKKNSYDQEEELLGSS